VTSAQGTYEAVTQQQPVIAFYWFCRVSVCSVAVVLLQRTRFTGRSKLSVKHFQKEEEEEEGPFFHPQFCSFSWEYRYFRGPCVRCSIQWKPSAKRSISCSHSFHERSESPATAASVRRNHSTFPSVHSGWFSIQQSCSRCNWSSAGSGVWGGGCRVSPVLVRTHVLDHRIACAIQIRERAIQVLNSITFKWKGRNSPENDRQVQDDDNSECNEDTDVLFRMKF
jgi:hypothetical protein